MDAVAAGAVVLAALAFAWTNGFHDASNAVATSLATGALTPRVALAMSAVLNAAGALIGVGIVELVGTRLLDVPVARPGVTLVLCAVLAAIAWNLVTWCWGMPSSSSQALLGALAGAGTAAGVRVQWGLIETRVVVPMLLSPVLGFVAAWLVVFVLLRVFRDAAHGPAIRRFRMAQGVSSAAVAVGHGLQDGQKSMGAVMLALVAAGGLPAGTVGVPLWVRLSVAGALGLGTLSGGWRIIRTLARRVVPTDPVTGFAAQSVTALVLLLAAGFGALPVSTTQTVTSAIVGAGSTAGLRAVRWTTVRRVLAVWVLTAPVTFGAAAGLFALADHLG